MARRKNPHAVALGRKGGKKGGPKGGPKGGKARWEGVPPEERSEIARRAVMARWRKRTKWRGCRRHGGEGAETLALSCVELLAERCDLASACVGWVRL